VNKPAAGVRTEINVCHQRSNTTQQNLHFTSLKSMFSFILYTFLLTHQNFQNNDLIFVLPYTLLFPTQLYVQIITSKEAAVILSASN
jgi:hypothetical protein